MSLRFPAGYIGKADITPTGSAFSDAAPGVWTITEALYWKNLGLWPTFGPTADFDFVDSAATFDSRITYTGASARMHYDSTGTLKYAPMNLLLWSDDISQAAWLVVATASVTGTSTLNLPATNDYLRQPFVETITAGLARTAQVKLSGTGTVQIAIIRTGGGTSESTFVPVTLTATPTIYTVTHTFAFSQTGWEVRVGRFSGDTATAVTVEDAMANLGPTAFDYIPTTTAAVYLPRSNAYQDHDPATLAPLGFLIEEQRTNSIRNNTMQGAVAGTPGTYPTNWVIALNGTATGSVVGFSTENGITYIDIRIEESVSGGSSILFDSTTQVVAADGQTWTNSLYPKLAGGTVTNLTLENRLVFRTAAGAGVATQNVAIVPTTAALGTVRSTNTFTASGGTIARVSGQLAFTFSGPGDITLRIGLPQLELGAFATSPILTTGAAATRLADVASITGTNFSSFWNQTEGTIVIAASRDTLIPSGVFPALLYVSDGTGAERFLCGGVRSGIPSNRVYFDSRDNNVQQFDISTVLAKYDMPLSTLNKRGLAYKVDDIAASPNGEAVDTDNTATIPSVTRMDIGCNFLGASQWGGHLQSLTYYAKRLPNATLQSLTV